MAYCPRCGVEVDNNVRICPLCDFPIPDIGEDISEAPRYPVAVNTYHDDHLEKKNQIFYSLEIITLAAVLITLVLMLVMGRGTLVLSIVLAAEVTFALFLLFCFNYLPLWLNFLGCYLTTLGFGLAMHYLIGNLDGWYTEYMAPITTLFFADLVLIQALYRKNRRKNQFVYVPVCILLFAILLSLGIDGILSYNLMGRLEFGWSLIVTISGLAVIALLMGIYYGVPEKTKAYLKKKLHV